MKYPGSILLALFIRYFSMALFFCVSGLAGAMPAGDASSEARLALQGKRMYLEGILPSGKQMPAILAGDVPFGAGQAACVGCHRRSGQGSSEGLIEVPPLTSAWLYQPRRTGTKKQAFIARGGRPELRPAYTDDTLIRAIRTGIDPAGRGLAQPMPHYELSEDELRPLIAYLKTLSSGTAPGVTDEEIHFATVITDGVDPAKRKAVLSVLKAYFSDHGAKTRQAASGQQRKWQLHVWQLKGPASSWTAQLETHYRKQPVFAVVGGIGAGSWQPVHKFCERHEIPDLFPNTDLPEIAEKDFYTVYFSKGAALEAEVLANYFHDQPDQHPGTIVQVFGADEWGRTAAQALAKSLSKQGIDGLRNVDVGAGKALSANFWKSALDCNQPGTVVIWQRDPDLRGLDESLCGDKLRGIYLSSSLKTAAFPSVPDSFRDRIYAVHQFDLAKTTRLRYQNIEKWMRAKHIDITDPRLQANTFVAVSTLGSALMRLDNNFSSEYLIERVEDMGDSAAISPVYPNFSLGPNQRFASKGGYIVKMMTSGVLFPVSNWIVP